MNNIALSFQNIYKTYTQAEEVIRVLRGVNLSICYGDMIAITGESGSGKSTILNIAGLFENIDEGTLILNGEDVSNLDQETVKNHIRYSQLGFVSQNITLLKNFTVVENIKIAFMNDKSVNYNKYMTRMYDLLNRLGIIKKANAYVGDLSGGEIQRVSIARALVKEPKLILADEPTGHLDPDTSNIVFNLLMEQSKKLQAAILLVTHDLSLAQKMDNRYHLKNGLLSTY